MDLYSPFLSPSINGLDFLMATFAMHFNDYFYIIGRMDISGLKY